MPRLAIPFFTDQCVPDSVGKTIIAQGHGLTRLRDCMATDTKDPLVALVCAENSQVLVSHDKDFKAVAKRLRITRGQYHRQLHRIALRCDEPIAAQRFGDTLPLIESEWMRAHHQGQSMVIEIYDEFIKLMR